MLEGKALVEDSDMPVKMQIEAMTSASQALDLYDVVDCKSIAAHIKKEFDMIYGSGWQCVVGSNFGCFFTHSQGTFIYFTLETLNFLIFKVVVKEIKIQDEEEREKRDESKQASHVIFLDSSLCCDKD